MSSWKHFSKDLIDRDLTKFPAIIYLALVFFISRAPFINLGFGAFTSPTDQDVLAVVNSAYLLRYENVYAVSRFPGSPFYEIFNSFLIGGGWLATNTATTVVSLISVILFGRILSIFEIENKSLLTITFSFIPVIWINSTITMDYMWSLMFLLLAFYLILKEKFNYSGIALSFAIGCRITSIVMVIPLLYLLFNKKCDKKTIFSFLGTAVIASLVIFSPVLYTYGFEFLKYTPREITFDEVFYGISTQILSIPAILIFLISLIMGFKIPKNDTSYKLSLLVIFIYALLFIYHPSKPAYLIPALPWVLIILNRSFPRIIVIILCLLIVSNGLVSVDFQKDDGTIKIEHGSILKNYEDRKPSVIQSKAYMESLSEALKKG